MKFNTFDTYYMTATVYSIHSYDNSAPIYTQDRVIKCHLLTKGIGSSISLLTQDTLTYDDRVGDIKDPNGEPVGEPMYTIRYIAPVVNSYGYVEGHNYSLTAYQEGE